MTARLCILLVALAVIARTRVAVLPGWVVPLPVLLVAAQLLAFLLVVAWLVVRVLHRQPAPAPAGESASPEAAAGAAGGAS